ncbi:MAG: response regulator, partial [Ardenticatenales bacterium]|nr:response regulator [Ardenticatenales bacterium]
MRNSIQTRLTIAFIGLAIGPLLVVGSFLAWRSYTVQQQQALLLQGEVAQRVAAEVGAFIQQMESDLHLLVQVQDIARLSESEQSTLLSELIRYEDGFAELTLLDKTGQEQLRLSASGPFPKERLRSRAVLAEFLIPKTRQEVYYGPVWFDDGTGEPLMTLSLPIADQEEPSFQGALIATIRLRNVWDLISATDRGGLETVYIVDPLGRVIAHREPSVVLGGTRFAPPDEDGIHEGLSGSSVVLATETIQLGNQSFHVIAEKPVSEALALAISTVRVIIALILVALLGAIGLGVWALHQIVRPIRALATTAQAISSGDLSKQAIIHRKDEIGALGEAFNSMTTQLRSLISTLEERVAERTQDLQRRSLQLQVAAEVARDSTAAQDLDELLNRAVELIRDRFGFYHAGIFLVDTEGEYAILHAATGEAGRIMLERQHNLKVGEEGIVGYVTQTGLPRIALDVGSDAVHFKNPLLPDTHSEMALPLKVGDRVIGALDVQSRNSAAFDDEDIAVLQTMADQLAIAIQNMRAFAQLRKTAEQMREVDKLKSQFLGAMSHELRTPLNAIIGFTLVLLKGISGPVTDTQRTDLTTIYNSGQSLLQLIDSILDISKIEAGKMELAFETVNLQRLIETVCNDAQRLIKDKPIKLVQELPPSLPPIRADAQRLRQVLISLLSNAAKFTDEGEIRLSLSSTEDEVIFCVSDTGMGIAPEKQLHLFDAFYQADNSGTRKVGGAGLGLAITQCLVEMHGGQIQVESSGMVGKGSAFYVSLPVQGPAILLDKKGPEQNALILAVDDEPAITRLYERYLTPEGYRFAACHDPQRAAKEALEMHPQLILLDLQMPAMDGLAVIAALRKNVVTHDIPIVLCSKEAITAQLEAQGVEAGASDFLQKPVSRQGLLTAVQRWTK